VKYYEIAVEATALYLSIGFFLFSSFSVLNNTILETWPYSYATLWNMLGTLAFVATLLLWIWAVREKQPETALGPVMMPQGAYYAVVPEINDRLKALNDQLSQFWRVEARRP
jgi:type VI protein secretion system component VasK